MALANFGDIINTNSNSRRVEMMLVAAASPPELVNGSSLTALYNLREQKEKKNDYATNQYEVCIMHFYYYYSLLY